MNCRNMELLHLRPHSLNVHVNAKQVCDRKELRMARQRWTRRGHGLTVTAHLHFYLPTLWSAMEFSDWIASPVEIASLEKKAAWDPPVFSIEFSRYIIVPRLVKVFGCPVAPAAPGKGQGPCVLKVCTLSLPLVCTS